MPDTAKRSESISMDILHRAAAVLTFVILLLCCGTTYASIDSLFKDARQSAYNGNYDVALEKIGNILEVEAEHTDALLLKGMVLLWKKDYSSAETILEKVAGISPEYRDAWRALVKAQLWGGKATAACSTLYRAEKIVGYDTLLASLRERVCAPDPVETGEVPSRKIDIFTGIGTTLFERNYNRSPWAHLECGINWEKSRWGIMAAVNAERRLYATARYGVELEVAPRFSVLPKLQAIVRLSGSPYALVDTVYASKAVKIELLGGLPGGVEVDGAARMGWYGEQKAFFCSGGIGKYIRNYLITARIFVAPVDRTTYLSGTGTVRRYSRKNEFRYFQSGVVLGRSPYEAGTFTSGGYFSILGCLFTGRIPVSRVLSIEPSCAVTGEQLVQTGDFNGDDVTDRRVSEIRMRIQCMVKLHIMKE